MKSAIFAMVALAALATQALAVAIVDEVPLLPAQASNAAVKGDRQDAPVAPKGDLLPVAGGYEALQIPGLATVAFPVGANESFAIRIPLMVVSAD